MTPNASNSWIHIAKPHPQARLRLFCFHYAGGGASAFRSWQSKMPPEIELCLVQLPGRETRIMEPLFTRLPPLIDALTTAIRPYLNKPFAFFGHSMGTLVSFELTRQLRAQQLQLPLHFFASAHRAPQIENPDPPIHNLADKGFIVELNKLNGTSQRVLENDELMQMMLPIIRADFAVCETYTYRQEPPFACAISAYCGLADPNITRDYMEAWHLQTSKTFKLTLFEGDHFYLFHQQDSLLQLILADLARPLDHLSKILHS
jgi:medium-chain acyl-[acyl-carrier-protein] hydrolase